MRMLSFLACSALLLGLMMVGGPSWAACDGLSALKSWEAMEITGTLGPVVNSENPLFSASDSKAPVEPPARPLETAPPSMGQQKPDQPSSPPKGAIDPPPGSAPAPPVKEAPGSTPKMKIKDDQGC